MEIVKKKKKKKLVIVRGLGVGRDEQVEHSGSLGQ